MDRDVPGRADSPHAEQEDHHEEEGPAEEPEDVEEGQGLGLPAERAGKPVQDGPGLGIEQKSELIEILAPLGDV